MKALTRALCLAFVMVGMLGVTGCGPDNEAEGLKASSNLGDPGKPAEGSGAPIDLTPSTNADRAKKGPSGSILMQGKNAAKPAAADKK